MPARHNGPVSSNVRPQKRAASLSQKFLQMKTPFRHQASEYDCVPTTALNTLSYLYERNEIPPLAIQRIFMYCLDSVSTRQGVGHGTSSYAVQLFGNWLNSFKLKLFSNEATYICGSEVHLAQNNRISRGLNSGGVALLNVTTQTTFTHYILGLSVQDSWIYAFDPYPKTSRANQPGKYEYLLPEHGQAANIRIDRNWMDTLSNKGSFRFGIGSEREALLIRRTEA